MKQVLRLFVVISFLTLYSNPTTAQIIDPVKWGFSMEKLNDSEVMLYFKAKVEDPWHIYAQDPNGGFNPTTFTFEESENYRREGGVKEPGNFIRKEDKVMDITYNLYSHEVIFSQKIKIINKKGFNITGSINYFSCDDSKCLPPKDEDFVFKINGKTTSTEETKGNEGNQSAVAETNNAESATTLFSNAVKQGDDTINETGPVEKQHVENETIEEDKSLLTLFLRSFGGGLLALLTPCVYPIIPLTVSFFMRGAANKRKAIFSGLSFSFSIILIYTGVGLIMGLFKINLAGDVASSWIANLVFFLVFMIFSLSFFGMFELTLPSSWANSIDAKADKGGMLGTFFMALATVVISFSCTGPIVGSLIGSSLKGDVVQPVIGMFAFSLAFSLPFPIFAMFPQLLKKMPKSGGWMNSVKIFFAFLMVAFSLKFLSNMDVVLRWNIISRELFISLWVIISILLGFYFLGKIKFSHDSEVTHVSVSRIFLSIASFTFAFMLFLGLFGYDLKSLSGFLPEKKSGFIQAGGVSMVSNESYALCGEPKYSDIFHLPHGLKGYYTIEEGFKCAKELNKPVFLDFKGHVCTNCKAMEQQVWSNPEVLKKLREDFIIIALFNDDRTKLPESEWYTSEVDGRVKKTIGARNSDYQAQHFNANAYPYYIIVDHDGNALVDPTGYDPDIEKFISFLDKGAENFKK